jgi:eukaryotic-like serine/threonine-protein kinase
MTGRRVCARCGTTLRAYAAGRLCPGCLLRGGLGGEEGQPPFGEGTAPDTQTAPLPRSVGDYELLEMIARGGMGIVYRARQKSLNRVVAVKMLLAGEFAQPKFIERFRSEAEAVARLQHPNIVAIHEVGEHEGLPFFSMDYVEGKNLAEVTADLRFAITDFSRTARWMKTMAEAVQYAHQHGIIHRDLKPSNVLIDRNDQPRITDFGLAKRFDASGDESTIRSRQSTITLSGEVLGSPNYLPPEQAGEKHGRVGPRSDLYSLGAILYHLLTGRPPFQAESLTSLLKQVVEIDPVPPRSLNPGIPRDLETICLKSLEKESPHRYATAQELAEELGRFLEGKPIHARPVNVAGKVWKWCWRQPVRASLAGALLLVLVLGITGISWQWRRAERERRAAVAAKAEAEIRQYTESITLAQSLIQAQQFGQGRETLLTRTPESYRGWEWGRLLQSCYQDLMTLSDGPALGVEAVFSPDSRFLLTSGFNPLIRIWDLATGEAIGSLLGHIGVANMTSFSPDGRRLCTFSWTPEDGTARI